MSPNLCQKRRNIFLLKLRIFSSVPPNLISDLRFWAFGQTYVKKTENNLGCEGTAAKVIIRAPYQGRTYSGKAEGLGSLWKNIGFLTNIHHNHLPYRHQSEVLYKILMVKGEMTYNS